MNELNGMTCAELADVAAELALGVLTGRERAVAIAHLDTCDACREDVRQMMGTAERLRGLLPQAEPPAGFETRVLQRLGLPAPADRNDQNDQNDQDDRNAGTAGTAKTARTAKRPGRAQRARRQGRASAAAPGPGRAAAPAGRR